MKLAETHGMPPKPIGTDPRPVYRVYVRQRQKHKHKKHNRISFEIIELTENRFRSTNPSTQNTVSNRFVIENQKLRTITKSMGLS